MCCTEKKITQLTIYLVYYMRLTQNYLPAALYASLRPRLHMYCMSRKKVFFLRSSGQGRESSDVVTEKRGRVHPRQDKAWLGNRITLLPLLIDETPSSAMVLNRARRLLRYAWSQLNPLAR